MTYLWIQNGFVFISIEETKRKNEFFFSRVYFDLATAINFNLWRGNGGKEKKCPINLDLIQLIGIWLRQKLFSKFRSFTQLKFSLESSRCFNFSMMLQKMISLLSFQKNETFKLKLCNSEIFTNDVIFFWSSWQKFFVDFDESYYKIHVRNLIWS